MPKKLPLFINVQPSQSKTTRASLQAIRQAGSFIYLLGNKRTFQINVNPVNQDVFSQKAADNAADFQHLPLFKIVLLISYNNIIHSRQDGVINREKIYSTSLLGPGDRAFKPERWHIKDVQFKLEPDSRGLLFLK